MTRIILTIPVASPSLNTVTGQHWVRYYRQKKLWRQLVMVAKAEARVFGDLNLSHAKIHVVRHGARLLDPDNLTGGLKVTIDALKSNGIILDDSPAHITLTVEQHIAPTKEHRTMIHVERVEAA